MQDMDSDTVLQEPPSAKNSSWIISRFIAARVGAGLVVVLVIWSFLLCLPSLKPIALHILYRLRDVSVFLFFTTAIAIGIFRSPQPSVQTSNIGARGQYPLSSIFGEEGDSGTEYCTSDVAEWRPTTPSTHRAQKAQTESIVHPRKEFTDSNHNVYVRGTALALSVLPDSISLSRRATERVAKNEETTPTHRRNDSASSHGENHPSVLSAGAPLLVEATVPQRELHSSFDQSVSKKADAPPDDQAPPASYVKGDSGADKPNRGATGSVKTPKKVTFAQPNDNWGWTKLEMGENEAASASSEIISNTQPGIGVAGSHNELNTQADMFIAKFKEQMRMQKLESFQRYLKRPS